MAEYQVFARKYRPQKFADVVGQEAIVATLKNMIRLKRLAHAFLFCGSRGTGKTTLARLLAKALNCENLGPDQEPCNACHSCKEMATGHSIDFLEIDGASNRGIDDIRKLNETVGYATRGERYQIILIDEVHMLTKEAFNALLKTLEEPPPKAKFFFATTEPHKVLPTILSRCQRFNLRRISSEGITAKLKRIAAEMKLSVTDEALALISQMAEGGLRDAESLFDQLVAFHEGEITVDGVNAVFGTAPRSLFFTLDRAGHDADYKQAFAIVASLFEEGKDLNAFYEGLIEHFRHLLVTHLAGIHPAQLPLMPGEREQYAASAKLYRREQCMEILDHLIEQQDRFRFAASPRIFLEVLLLYIMRSHRRISIDQIVDRLEELKSGLELPQREEKREDVASPPKSVPAQPAEIEKLALVPSPAQTAKVEPGNYLDTIKKQSRYDTLMQFAAVEMGGRLQKNP